MLLVKLYEADDDLTLRLVVDTSASMGYDGSLLAAQRLAVMLGFVGLVRGDAVTVSTVDGSRAPRRFTGRGSSGALMAHLASFAPSGLSDLAAASTRVVAGGGGSGVNVLISDLLDPGWSDAVRRLPARGAELVVVHVVTAETLPDTAGGEVDLIDAETGERVSVSVTPDVLASQRRTVDAWRSEVSTAVRRSNGRYLQVDTADDLDALVLAACARGGVMA